MEVVISQLVSLVGQIATAVVAAIAIIANRRSTRDTVKKDIELKKWEKRAEVYAELLLMIDRLDPSHAKDVESVLAEVAEGRTSILDVDLSGDDWRQFDIDVRLYASVNVAILYAHWKRALSEWTSARMSLIINHDAWEASTTTEQASYQREWDVRTLMGLLRRELILHVRSELDFRSRALPKIKYSADGVSRISLPKDIEERDMEAYVGNDAGYSIDVERHPGGWSITQILETGLKAEDILNAERLYGREQGE